MPITPTPQQIEEQLAVLPQATIKAPDSTTAEKTTPLATPRTIISPAPAIEKTNQIKAEVDEIDRGIEEQAKRVAEEPTPRPEVSVVDYLASQGQPTSFSERAKLAEKAGITDYTGTAEQNTRLLEILKAQPKPEPPTPEEKRKKDLTEAFKGVFAPKEYEKDPFLKRPDETTEEYNVRVEALRKSGIEPPVEEPEEVEEIETPADILTKQIQDASNKIDEAYQQYASDLAKLRAGTFPLTADEQMHLSSTEEAFDDLKASQLLANKNYENAIRIAGIAAGRQRYAPEIEAGNIAQAVNLGIKRIAELDRKKALTLSELRSAIFDKNYKMIGENYDRFREYTTDKMNAMKDIYTIAKDEQDRVDAIISEQNKLIADSMKELDKQKADIIRDASKSGAPTDIISAIQEADSLADAVNIAGEYLKTGTGIVGEYLFYKREQERQGLLPVDFNTYQTIDANRKAKAQSLISGLDPKIASQVDAISRGFDTAPIVKQFNEVLNKKISVDDIIEFGVGGPADLSLVFEFMKALDPTSVVRESEYRAAKKAGNIFAGWATQFNGYLKEKGGFLPPSVKEEFKKIIALKFNAIQRQYSNLRTEKGRLIDRKTGDIDGTDYLTDYDISVGDMAEDIKDKVDDFIIANPETAEIAAQMAEDGLSDEDIYNYLINSQ